MTIGVDPPDAREQARIAVVHAFDILGTPPDGTFDRIAAVAARTFDVPIGIVSIVDTDRIWSRPTMGCAMWNRSTGSSDCAHQRSSTTSRGWSWMPRPTPAR